MGQIYRMRDQWSIGTSATDSVVSKWSFRERRSIIGAMALDPTQLQQAAKDHLWMHFTRHGSYKDNDVPVIVRGEGPYIWDSNGKKYLDALAGLFVSQLGHGRA